MDNSATKSDLQFYFSLLLAVNAGTSGHLLIEICVGIPALIMAIVIYAEERKAKILRRQYKQS